MALTAADVILRVQDILTDTNAIRWPSAELLRHLNDGRRATATLRPDIYATQYDDTLVAGVVQTLPGDGRKLIDVLCNLTSAGAPAAAVRVTQKELLDAQNPLWTVGVGSYVRNFMYDERYPKKYLVYPGAIDGAMLRIVYSRDPADITNTATELAEEGGYALALVDYIVYRALMKDAAFGANAQRAQTHYQMFTTTLGVGATASIAVSPNTSNQGGSVPRAAAA